MDTRQKFLSLCRANALNIILAILILFAMLGVWQELQHQKEIDEITSYQITQITYLTGLVVRYERELEAYENIFLLKASPSPNEVDRLILKTLEELVARQTQRINKELALPAHTE